MSFLALIAIGLPLTATAAGFAMAALVLWGAPERRLARMFALFATNIGLWNLLLGLQAIPGLAGSQPRLMHLLRFAVLLLPATCLHTAVFWAGRTEQHLRVQVVIGYVLAALLMWAQTQTLVWA
jgi:hypothetical protein